MIEELQPGKLRDVGLRQKFNALVAAVRSLQRGENVAVSGSMSKRTGKENYTLEGPPPRTPGAISSLALSAPLDYKDTAIQLTFAAPTGYLAGSSPPGATLVGGMTDLTSTPDIKLNIPGRHRIHWSVTCSYAAACAQALNLSDCTSRVRLKIAGSFVEDSASCQTHHAKLRATGLVRDVSGTVDLPVMTADVSGLGVTSEALSGSEGYLAYISPITSSIDPSSVVDVSGSEDELDLSLAVTKVSSYNRWVSGKVTISGSYPVTVIPTEAGPRILAGALSTTYPLAIPTIGLWIDRSEIETDPGVAPLDWFAASATELTCHSATLQVEYLGG